ncbi:MAG: hypothetical protein KKF30_04265 [Proteobacteria bacterium]|nr:hypothetical protein [Pseudomonadota bacterium]MBU4471923.1 hypothetical protein [Pseudomonadota bacterium]MCG2752801.1 hypothetical protein [Desulfobacteraceae bacterium]
MIANKKEFTLGASLMAGFIVVLVLIFLPLFNGHNGLDYLDALYNSISKGSAYYIPKMKEEIKAVKGKAINVTLSLPDGAMAEKAALLLNKSGALLNVSGTQVKVSGDLGAILANCLEDADALYKNDDESIKSRYDGNGAREMVYCWWLSLKEMEKNLKKQEFFKEAKVIYQVETKAVETAYNYYGIKAQNIKDKIGIVLFSLVFYVIYTLWYGYAILYMAEGWGLRLESH